MRVKVKLFTTLVNYFPGVQAGVPFDLELTYKSTVSDLIKRLNIPEPEAAIILVNGLNKPIKHELNNNDEVSIFPVIGGG
jgi:sulfur carrier protein ThiS